MNLRCEGISHGEESNMFTVGKEYPLRDDNTVIDDLGHPRFIGSSLTFIVKNSGSFFLPCVYKAYFEEIL